MPPRPITSFYFYPTTVGSWINPTQRFCLTRVTEELVPKGSKVVVGKCLKFPHRNFTIFQFTSEAASLFCILFAQYVYFYPVRRCEPYKMSVIIRLQNLPWSANAADIRGYFQGLSIPEGGVHIVGGEEGDAFIAFRYKNTKTSLSVSFIYCQPTQRFPTQRDFNAVVGAAAEVRRIVCMERKPSWDFWLA